MRFLFATWFGAGNQVPSIGLAQTLAARGHEVCFAGYASQTERFGDLGFEFRVLELSDAVYRADAPPEQVMTELLRGVWACPEQLLDLANLDADEFDAAVVDCMMFGALAALEQTPLPTAVLVHSAPGALAPPGGPGEELILTPVNELRGRSGLDQLGSLWRAWDRFPTVCATIRELDPLADHAPSPFRYLGPITEAVAPSGWTPPWPEHDQRPLVVASFSTGYAWDQRSRIERTLAALSDTEAYRVLVCTAMADVDGLAVPDNAVIMKSLPHGEIMPRAMVAVTHAGHGTVAAALTHGVPIVALPNPAADQPPLAARAAELGAGIALDGETATPAQIASAAATVLDDDSFRIAARSLSAKIAAAPGANGAAELLENLADHRGESGRE